MIYVNIMLVLAIAPGLFFIRQVYRLDKIEKEPKSLIRKLMLWGAIGIIPAMIGELIGSGILACFVVNPRSVAYLAIENFAVIAVVEEGVKYLVTKRCTWKHPAFNFLFDGVVYAVSASMGFAILENVMYCFSMGFSTAIARAFLSIPGHGFFGIFMGHYYGLAKRCELDGDRRGEKQNKKKAVLVPALIHGFYDFCLSTGSVIMTLVFYGFMILLYIIAFREVKAYSMADEPL